MCKQQINNINEKCRRIARNFDCHHADVAVQCGAHCPMEHILGITQTHWMLPLGKCSHCIAVAAAMVDKFGRKHKALKTICS
jgi:hypothetical protein